MRSLNKQQGFTLVELVIVMVILGILAITAVPTFIDIRADARQAAVDGVAGVLGSGAAVNYAARSANAANGIAIADCDDTDGTLAGGALPTGYTIGAQAVAAGSTTTCTVTGPDGDTATFVTIGIA